MNTVLRSLAAVLVTLLALPAPAPAGPRIVNGLPASGFSSVGALLYGDGGAPAEGHLLCSGTLIGCRTFLTAAHCLAFDSDPSSYAVFLQHGGIAAVTDMVVHPDYAAGSAEHDLAVLRLAQPVEGLPPAPINVDNDLQAMGAGMPGTIVGFGRTGSRPSDYGIKRYGAIQTASCDPMIAGAGDEALVCWNFDAAIGPAGSDSNTCNGDSGGPLFMDFGNGSELAGVTSAGVSSSCFEDHGIDVSVFSNQEWLQEQLGEDSLLACGELAEVESAAAPARTTTGIFGRIRRQRTETIPLAAQVDALRVTLNGTDNGFYDHDLYVRVDGPASSEQFDCASTGSGVFEACELRPVSGSWVSVVAAAVDGMGEFQLTVTQFRQDADICGDGTIGFAEDCEKEDNGSCAIGPCSAQCTCPAPVCGNGFLEQDEGCDDGNVDAGDGCDASCGYEVADACTDAVELPAAPGTLVDVHGSTIGLSDDPAGCGHSAGDAWYRLEISQPTTLLAETDGRFDSVLSLVAGTCGLTQIVACDDNDGLGGGSAIGPIVVEPGTYFLVVDGAGAAEGPFVLTMRAEAAGCGNGILEDGETCETTDLGECPIGPCTDGCDCPEPICGNAVVEDGEECDDGNTAGGDTCDGACRNLGPLSCEQAPSLSGEPGVQHVSGSTIGAADTGRGCGGDAGEAWYRLELDRWMYVTAETDGLFDSTLARFAECDDELADQCNDDGGTPLGSRLGPSLLGPGVHHLVVDGFGNAEGDFTLTVELAPTVCGNAIREIPAEQCDGTSCLFGPCGEDCRCPDTVCGDGKRQGEESCDGADLGGCKVGPCSESCTCPSPVCGNDVRESTEQCDGNDLGACPAGPCRNDCRCPAPVCGNGIREGFEDCDGSSAAWCTTGCGEDCRCVAECGNGIREEGERCDGDDLGSCSGPTCLGDCECAPAVCGNNDRENGEQCDGWDDSDCSYGPCRQDCTCTPPACGDGVREGWEQCDGVQMGWCLTGPCGANCTCPSPICGNGVLEPGEECDTEKLDACLVGPCREDCSCPEPVCGNGVIEPAETCDDGGTASGDSCSPVCAFLGPDSCEEGLSLPTQWGTHLIEGTTGGAVTPSAGCGSEGLTWHELDLTETAVITVRVVGEHRFDLGLHKGDCDDPALMRCQGPTIGRSTDLGPVTLLPGRYHLTVSGNAYRFDYALTLHLAPPGCGNGVPEIGEQCDDGNSPESDDCSAECELIGAGTCQDAVALPSDPGVHYVGGTTIGTPDSGKGCGDAGDAWYTLDLPATSMVSFQTDGRFDSFLTLFGGTCNALSQRQCADEGAWPPGASGLGPVSLVPGRYFLLVDGHDTRGPEEGDFVLTVRIQPQFCGNDLREPGESCDGADATCSYGTTCRDDCSCAYPDCGDGLREWDEECDDGNATAGDGCHQCELEAPQAWLCDAFRYWDDLCDCGCGLDDAACISQSAWACHLNWCDLGSFPDLDENSLCFQPCGNGTLELGYQEQCDDGNTAAGDGCSRQCRPEPPAGWVCEDEAYSDGECTCGCGARDIDCPAGFDFLCDRNRCRIGLPVPEANHECFNPNCGNAQIDGGEQCDDANSVSGDGCDSLCLDEPLLLQACGAYAGAGASAGGAERFTFVLDQTSEVSLWTRGEQTLCPSAMDLTLYDSTGRRIADGEDLIGCPTLVVELMPGSYVAVVEHPWWGEPLPPYVVEFRNSSLGCSACGNGIRQGEETCDDGHDNSTTHGTICSTDCIVTQCGSPVSRSGPHRASDALFILKAAVGSVSCDVRVCDTNRMGGIRANDALRILRRAVGLPEELKCWDY